MLGEIGVVVALYVLFQVFPANWPTTRRALGVVAAAAALVTVVDIAYTTVRGSSVFSILANKRATSAVEVDENDEQRLGAPAEVSVTRADGGSITTNLGYGFAVAKGSSLKREWIAVHDARLPVHFVGTPGVGTYYKPEGYGGEYRYRAQIELEVTQPVRAVEVRFLTFNVWGQHEESLSVSEVKDFPVGKTAMTAEWQLYSENDVESHYASIAYVARVRLTDGRIVEMETLPVVEEARKFSEKFEAADLDPEEPKAHDKKQGER